MRRLWLVLLLSVLAPWASAKSVPAQGVVVHGNADGNTPGWTISTHLPNGWTHDCCMYARGIGVNLVLYQGEWTGKPERVMVLNVWPAKQPTLAMEMQDDRQHYLQSDPHGKANGFPVTSPRAMACQGVLYQGSDHLDDVVVFCDPGKASGIRYSWSMTVSATDPQRQALLDTFKQVVQHSSYTTYVQGPAAAHTNATP
ncbi:MAG TPA: hypothetical protein VMA74_20220 [Dyella sp.]|uniref:hypothetical protein n=1 Tax=Dyella sp. TaxID=1869338 RepID=UPI002B6E3C9F|nr:hypothetical protein [Dyella sp.]HUB92060.1 hypothetical protein [Dyella sp.]